MKTGDGLSYVRDNEHVLALTYLNIRMTKFINADKHCGILYC